MASRLPARAPLRQIGHNPAWTDNTPSPPPSEPSTPPSRVLKRAHSPVLVGETQPVPSSPPQDSNKENLIGEICFCIPGGLVVRKIAGPTAKNAGKAYYTCPNHRCGYFRFDGQASRAMRVEMLLSEVNRVANATSAYTEAERLQLFALRTAVQSLLVARQQSGSQSGTIARAADLVHGASNSLFGGYQRPPSPHPRRGVLE